MTDFGSKRVMWLLNHGAARKFEIPMLKRVGFREFYLPKIFPSRIDFRSASADFSEDQGLTVPRDVVEHFNSLNWYEPQPHDVWKLASKYFDIAFFINDDSDASAKFLKHFRGAAIWRTYGLDKSMSYSEIVRRHPELQRAIVAGRERFWFGQAYSHLANIEAPFLRRRSGFLPLGMPDVSVHDEWKGDDRRILFICPDIGFNEYYQNVYADFKRGFGDLPYVVGGGQPVKVNDPHVLGYLSSENFERKMRELRVMYYHSREPRHVHYHPFEAVRAGMPLIFLAGGMLDSLGGRELPGRCKTEVEARQKIERILSGDQKLVEAVRQSQTKLLDAMAFEGMVPAWRQSMEEIVEKADALVDTVRPLQRKKKRIAVIVPVKYRGGSLRGAKMLAHAIRLGSAQAGEDVEVVLGHIDDPKVYTPSDFKDLTDGIKVRPYRWRRLDRAEAIRAMEYSGAGGVLDFQSYFVPDDGIQQFCDCDLWILVSDRIELDLLPIRPYAMMVYDYLQRYVAIMKPGEDTVFLRAARQARKVLVTTEFTRKDAIGYAGVSEKRVAKVPMLAPAIQSGAHTEVAEQRPYFVWSTNAAPHKNHLVALEALLTYYDDLGGTFDCVITGVNSEGLRDDDHPTLGKAAAAISRSRTLRHRVRVLGELPDAQYASLLKNAQFLWHPTIIDNGTFGVVEAARLGVPSLSSDYPAMREIDAQFELGLAFSRADDSVAMGQRLRWMEDNIVERRDLVPKLGELEKNSIERLSKPYWQVIRELL